MPLGFSLVRDTGEEVLDAVMTSPMTTRFGLSIFCAVMSEMAEAGRTTSCTFLLGDARADSEPTPPRPPDSSDDDEDNIGGRDFR